MTPDQQSSSSQGQTLYYLCQQAVRQGQGGYAHVTEIIDGLTRRGWTIRLFQPGYHRCVNQPLLLFRLPGMIAAEFHLMTTCLRPDIVYMRSHFITNLVAAWCMRRRIPFVEEVNGSETDADKAHPVLRAMRGMSRRAAVWRWRHAAAVIAVTPRLRDEILRVAPATHVEVVPTGANITLFHAPDGEPNPVGRPYVVFFGSLAPWHDLATMVAATQLPAWPSDMCLVILGSGRQTRMVQEAARNNARIIYQPAVPYRMVPLWVGHASAALSLLRTTDGLSPSPLKLYEAMACAVPVIVSEVPGQADLVRAMHCGVVIPEADPAALASAVAAVWNDPPGSAVMGKRAREAVVSGHSWDIRAEQTHDILLCAISQGRQCR